MESTRQRWYQANKAKPIARAAAWAAANLHKRQIIKRRHDAKKWKSTLRAQAKTPEGRLQSRRNKLKSKFGITLEEYSKMLETQQGVCAICGCPPGKRSLAVDHDHTTGQIRELLCGRCNTILGLVDEKVQCLEALAAYLVKHKPVSI